MMYNVCKLDKLTLLVNDSFLFPLKTGQYNLYQRVRTDIIYNFYNVNDDRIRKPKARKGGDLLYIFFARHLERRLSLPDNNLGRP